MLTVYHVAGTRSVRILWLLNELGLPYETVAMPFDHQILHGADFRRLNPLGKVPTIDDDGFLLTESGAITQYILAKYGEGRLELAPRPQPGSPPHGRFLQWLYFPEATMMPPLGTLVRERRAPEAERHVAVCEHAAGLVGRFLRYTDAELSDHDYILGATFTAADIMLGYSLSLADHLQLVGADYPRVRAYLERLSRRTAFRDALAA